MKSNYELKTTARLALKGHWAMPVLANLVGSILSGDLIVKIFAGNPVCVGLKNSLRRLLHKPGEDVFGDTFNIAFSQDYTHKMATKLLKDVYIFLWSLLLFVPGIVKAYSYAMTEFILQDEPDLDADSVLHKSRELMRGHKWDLFCLDLSFIGWFFLSLLTLGIGLLWLEPYMMTAKAAFYEDLIGYTEPAEEEAEEQ